MAPLLLLGVRDDEVSQRGVLLLFKVHVSQLLSLPSGEGSGVKTHHRIWGGAGQQDQLGLIQDVSMVIRHL
uniref:Uncharacterized protein n=1 Tax=Anguilla anguilla TaxID=7936 RepID=A0A0E9T3J4_ANGAN